jgi:hypothetical protein
MVVAQAMFLSLPAMAADFVAIGGNGGTGGATATVQGAYNPGLSGSNGILNGAADARLAGGAGGNSGTGDASSIANPAIGNGRSGNSATVSGFTLNTAYDNLTLQGGHGGRGGQGSNDFIGDNAGGAGGGGGGHGVEGAAGNLAVSGDFNLMAGNGGNGGNQVDVASGTGGAGGLVGEGGRGGTVGLGIGDPAGGGGGGGGGGNASFAATGSVQVDGALNVTSGANGSQGRFGTNGTPANAGQGGAGGNVRFAADTLKAGSIILNRNAGALNFNIQSLDVTHGDTTIGTTNTAAADVDFGAIHLGGDKTLDVSGAATDSYRFNTLNVHAENARIVGDIDLSQRHLNFAIPKGEEKTLLAVTGDANVSGATVTFPHQTPITFQGGRADHRQVSLLTTGGALTGKPANEGARFDGVQGVSIAYEYVLETDNAGKEMRLQATSTHATPQARALSEGFLSGVALMNQGVDLSVTRGIRLAVDSAERQTGYSVFGAMSGGHSSYESGSDMDIDGVSLILGASAGLNLAHGRLTLGAFAEYGQGDYDTNHRFDSSRFSLKPTTRVKGDGDTRYAGGGLLARYADDKGYYAEATVRAGRVKTDFSSSDLVSALGQPAKYDIDMNYYGAHVGVGYVWQFSEQGALDFYGKYLWLRQSGEHTTLSTGDDIRFKDTDSERLRVGARYVRDLSNAWQGYAGLAYEHEFDSKARATTHTVAGAYAIDSPDLKGDTGIGEIGLSIRQGRHSPISLDLGLQGYSGKREGVSGSIRLGWAF